jgi:hypothetical protein
MARLRKAILLTLAFVLVTLLVFATAFFIVHRPDSRLATSEQYAVYSAYLKSEIADNFHDYGSGKGFVLLIQDRTTVARVAASRLQRLKTDAPTLKDATLVNFVAQNIVSHLLDKRFDLSVHYELLPEQQLVKPESIEERFPAHAGYVTFSRVGFNRDLSQALFYTEHICGLCGGGGYVLMERGFGQWRVKACLSTWVS